MSELEIKLLAFKKKFYKNQLLKGLLLSLAGLTAFLLLGAFVEYFGHLSSFSRAFIFYSYLIFATLVLVKFIVIPTLKYFNIGNTLTNESASKIIGEHFPEIKDKLLNTLQLQNQAKNSQSELLLASVQQKTENLKPFTFTSAVNFSESFRKYGKMALIPMMLVGIILIFQSNIITSPVNRIYKYNEQFAKEAPFQFILKNTNLNVLKNSDLTLELETKGKALPQELFVSINNNLIKMEQVDKTNFKYTIQGVNNDMQLYFTDGEFNSNSYQIKALPNPSLLNFKIEITYPSHTFKKNEVIENTGDITVPEGSKLKWIFNTNEVENLSFLYENKVIQAQKNNNNFEVQLTANQNFSYFISLKNQFVQSKDTIKYNITALQDKYPNIAAEQKQDSINPFVYYFYGRTDDDYGLTKLQFVYKNLSNNSVAQFLPVPMGKSTEEIFYYMVDLRSLLKNEGDQFEYYFEVWDNDGVNGRKSAKSQVFKAISPDKEQLKADAESSSQSIKQKLNEAMKESMSIQKKSQEINKELKEKNNLDWQQEQKLKELLNDQKKLENKIEQLKTENKAKNEKEKQLQKEQDLSLLEKQKEIDKLFEQLMTPEMKDLLKKMEEMLKQQNKEELEKQLDKMKMDNQDMQKQLDRTLEQFKQMEIEKKLNEQIDELNELAKKQEELSEKTKNKSENQDDLKKEQEQINQEFKEIEKEIKDIEKKNNDLETPMDLDNTNQEQKEINEGLEESQESLNKKQNKKASESQKKNSDNMKKMAEKMKKSLEDAQEQQKEEDYFTLRQILENLIEISVEQENLMQDMKSIRGYNPKYVELSAKQQKIKEDVKLVEDSLLALSKRQIQIQSFVNKEITSVNSNMEKSIEHFSKVEIPNGTTRQQYVMTGINNLAVMLSETLKNMQESMKQDQEKKQGQCKNPGKKPGKPGSQGKPKMGNMKQMQDQLNKQMQEMKNGKQQGKNPTSEQFAKIAAQQEALRREIDRLQKMLKEEGKEGAYGDLNKTKELMEQQEKDLVNKQITPETLKRMEEIETRMLEHEKAEREQDQDNKREAEQAKEVINKIPPAIKEYLEKKAREMELLRTIPADMNPYYKQKVKDYFKKVGNA